MRPVALELVPVRELGQVERPEEPEARQAHHAAEHKTGKNRRCTHCI